MISGLRLWVLSLCTFLITSVCLANGFILVSPAGTQAIEVETVKVALISRSGVVDNGNRLTTLIVSSGENGELVTYLCKESAEEIADDCARKGVEVFPSHRGVYLTTEGLNRLDAVVGRNSVIISHRLDPLELDQFVSSLAKSSFQKLNHPQRVYLEEFIKNSPIKNRSLTGLLSNGTTFRVSGKAAPRIKASLLAKKGFKRFPIGRFIGLLVIVGLLGFAKF